MPVADFTEPIVGVIAKGDEIGIITTGKICASYNIGNTYTSGMTGNIITTQNNKKVAVYSITSTDAKVYANEKEKLINGKCRVNFADDFINVCNNVTVTVSPNGDCNGLYISSVDRTGFTVSEINKGTSNVEFSWISIGTRIEGTPELPTAFKDVSSRQQYEKILFQMKII